MGYGHQMLDLVVKLEHENPASSHLGQNITHGLRETRKCQIVDIPVKYPFTQICPNDQKTHTKYR